MRSVISAAFILLLLGGLLLGLLLSPSPPTQTASACVGGRQLTLTGPTAFAPVAGQIAKAYDKSCPTARIVVAADNNGSVNGLNTLVSAGPTAAGSQLAMSDGRAPAGYRVLDGAPVAIITFEVAVNRGVGLYNLTAAQIKGI
jgi:phosphate transport system substrate-binding protein